MALIDFAAALKMVHLYIFPTFLTFVAPVEALRGGGPLRPEVCGLPLLGLLVVALPTRTAHIIG